LGAAVFQHRAPPCSSPEQTIRVIGGVTAGINRPIDL
jgi:hypothetical protein